LLLTFLVKLLADSNTTFPLATSIVYMLELLMLAAGVQVACRWHSKLLLLAAGVQAACLWHSKLLLLAAGVQVAS
jgi:hypothetical protein